MKTVNILSAGILFSASLISCTRTENERSAGKGGSAILNCVPKHHDVSKNIVNGKIYIAYNADNIPSAYDDSASCTFVGGVPSATFNGLKAGKYYILGTGYDTSINQAVKGGLSYTINQETTLEITVPVTETHL